MLNEEQLQKLAKIYESKNEDNKNKDKVYFYPIYLKCRFTLVLILKNISFVVLKLQKWFKLVPPSMFSVFFDKKWPCDRRVINQTRVKL